MKAVYVSAVRSGEIIYVLNTQANSLAEAKKDLKRQLVELPGHPKSFLLQPRKTDNLIGATKYIKEKYEGYLFP